MLPAATRVALDRDAPLWKLFQSAAGWHVLVVPGTQLYDIQSVVAREIEGADPGAVAALRQLAAESLEGPGLDEIPEVHPQSISLNVSATCNLSCSYCYATRGTFDGVQSGAMTVETALTAIDRLLADADPHAPVTIGFMGGEPFANRGLVHRAVSYGAAKGRALGRDVRFSVTTNGTLLNDRDIQLLRDHPFAVTISVDGGRSVHDKLRPLTSGGSSFDQLRDRIRPLLSEPGGTRVAARATVTRTHFALRSRFRDIASVGFHEIGFTPVRRGVGALGGEDWVHYLNELVGLARDEIALTYAGQPMRLTNLAVALKQLRRGASLPYSCSAGGGYFSVAVNGTWYACHRAIGDPAYALGDSTGLNQARRSDFLRDQHVHSQPTCQTCWARYLCSGGCHHEASERTDRSCDFIRSWLEFCLQTYCELSATRPDLFADGAVS